MRRSHRRAAFRAERKVFANSTARSIFWAAQLQPRWAAHGRGTRRIEQQVIIKPRATFHHAGIGLTDPDATLSAWHSAQRRHRRRDVADPVRQENRNTHKSDNKCITTETDARNQKILKEGKGDEEKFVLLISPQFFLINSLCVSVPLWLIGLKQLRRVRVDRSAWWTDEQAWPGRRGHRNERAGCQTSAPSDNQAPKTRTSGRPR